MAYITSKVVWPAVDELPVYAYHGVHSEGVLQEIARLAGANRHPSAMDTGWKESTLHTCCVR